MIAFFQRIIRSVFFRIAATLLVLSLLLLFANFLLTVYQANMFLKESKIASWQVIINDLENAFTYGTVALGLLSIILIAAIFDLIYFMRSNYEFRLLSSAIVDLAAGNMATRVPVSAGGPLGEIQSSFNRMADSLVSNIEQLEENARFQKELVTNVAHDLGSPLTSILGYLDTISMKAKTITNEELQKYLLIARSNALYLSKLVTDLTTLSRFDASAISIFPESINIEQLFNSMEKRFAEQLARKGVRFVYAIDPAASCVAADRILFERAISNIIENAVKFSTDASTIKISSIVRDSNVAIKIFNAGTSIPDNDLPHVFNRFFRVGEDRSRDTGGSGLGLSIVLGIVQLHAAKISIENHEDGGVVVTLLFPSA